jgi:DNA-binding PadR family transcriptional regulator
MNLKFKQKIILTLLKGIDKKPMSPLQIMKSLFLFYKEQQPEDFYEFIPYLYGPCSFEVYKDLKILEEAGLIISHPTNRGWSLFTVTNKGEEYLIKDNIELIRKLETIKEFVLSKSFFELLVEIYSKYPEFAINSIFNFKPFKKL